MQHFLKCYLDPITLAWWTILLENVTLILSVVLVWQVQYFWQRQMQDFHYSSANALLIKLQYFYHMKVPCFFVLHLAK